MAEVRRLLIVSHVAHYEHEGRLFAYGPYAREIDIWAELFPEIIIAAPVLRRTPPGDASTFQRQNISFAPQRETGGDKLLAKVTQLLAIPGHFCRLARAMRRADAIHVRCPGNLGLLGCVLAPFFHKPRVAKYAGQWSEFEGEPLSWRFQKRLLRSRWWQAPVLVYGTWPDQPPHIVPFFTSMLNESQMARAARSKPRLRTSTMHVLFVGRLSSAKNVHVLLKAVAICCRAGEEMKVSIVGDGPERHNLETLAKVEGIRERVRFTGALPQEQVFSHYEKAHVLVLASETEGWPKALSEGMAFANVCIASNRGLVPQMLAAGRGLLVEPGSVPGLSEALTEVYQDPVGAVCMAEAAAAWSRRFTLEGYGSELRNTLRKYWRRNLDPHSAVPQIVTNDGA